MKELILFIIGVMTGLFCWLLNYVYHYYYGYTVYKAFTAKWDVSFDDVDLVMSKYSTYEIRYNRRTDTYSLATGGYMPKKHSMYPKVVDMVCNLNDKKQSLPPIKKSYREGINSFGIYANTYEQSLNNPPKEPCHYKSCINPITKTGYCEFHSLWWNNENLERPN